MIDQSNILSFLRRNWIPIEPGFHNHPNFRKQERNNPELLQLYADYVDSTEFDDQYLNKAEVLIVSAAKLLHGKLVSNGMHGRCANASAVLSQFLDRKGVWNYLVRGGLSYYFDPITGLSEYHISPIGNPAGFGHVWVCAPPFRIVDITASLQNLDHARQSYVQDAVLCKTPRPELPEVANLMDASEIRRFRERYAREPSIEDVYKARPGLEGRLLRFGVTSVDLAEVRLRYSACAITAASDGLEKVGYLDMDGKKPIRLFEEWKKEVTAQERQRRNG